jgi:hypothetical protein
MLRNGNEVEYRRLAGPRQTNKIEKFDKPGL